MNYTKTRYRDDQRCMLGEVQGSSLAFYVYSGIPGGAGRVVSSGFTLAASELDGPGLRSRNGRSVILLVVSHVQVWRELGGLRASLFNGERLCLQSARSVSGLCVLALAH